MTPTEPREDKTAALLRAALMSTPGERITIEQLLEPLRRRAFGFLLLLLAIPNFIPVPLGIGGIMGVPRRRARAGNADRPRASVDSRFFFAGARCRARAFCASSTVSRR